LDEDRGLVLIAVKRTSGHLEFNPGSKVLLAEGDKLIVLGQPESLKRLEAIVRSHTVA
jgi:voltage-gated potassium channel